MRRAQWLIRRRSHAKSIALCGTVLALVGIGALLILLIDMASAVHVPSTPKIDRVGLVALVFLFFYWPIAVVGAILAIGGWIAYLVYRPRSPRTDAGRVLTERSTISE